MSSSPAAHSSSSDSGSSQPNTPPLRLENIIEEHHKATLPHSADALPHDAQLHSVDALPYVADALPHHPADISSPSNLPQISTTTMAPNNRSRGRDVHIYDINDPSTVLGGLLLTNGVTNTNFYSMVEILFLFQSDFELRDEGDARIEKDDNPLRPGSYYIHAAKPFLINDEPWLLRTISVATGTRVQSFCDTIRSRDGRCVISGKKAVRAYLDIWTGFEAAHVFPLAYEGHWTQNDYGRWITIPPQSGGTISSVQNGMLLDCTIHQLFDTYCLSINPDDNYKIVYFTVDGENLAGKYLDQQFRDDPQRPIDQLLRWHFRQAVLANMRGAGEPTFEHDFPPGSDIVGDILGGPKAGERMEFELFSRLAAQVECNVSSA